MTTTTDHKRWIKAVTVAVVLAVAAAVAVTLVIVENLALSW